MVVTVYKTLQNRSRFQRPFRLRYQRTTCRCRVLASRAGNSDDGEVRLQPGGHRQRLGVPKTENRAVGGGHEITTVVGRQGQAYDVGGSNPLARQRAVKIHALAEDEGPAVAADQHVTRPGR